MKNFALLSACMTFSMSLVAAEWHVAPDGKKNNAGTVEAPWDLISALAHPKAVQPGDTIWVHGGSYHAPGKGFNAALVGTSKSPITVAAWRRERVTLTSSLIVGSDRPAAHAHYRDLEISATPPGKKRMNFPGIKLSSTGGAIDNPGIKVINCEVHDNGSNGIAYWANAYDSEVHGCLIYNNGIDQGNRGYAHGMYVQNNKKPKLIKNNIIFRNFFAAIQVYGTGKAPRDFVTLEGNTSFNSGEISKISGFAVNLWVAGGRVAEAPRVIDNCTYAPAHARMQRTVVGNSRNAIVRGNYFMAPGPRHIDALHLQMGNTDLSVTNNVFYGRIHEYVTASKVVHIDANKYGKDNVRFNKRPTGLKIFIRPNDYEKGRANITIYNWDKQTSVAVDISKAGLKKGDAFEVRDVQNWYGKAIATGTYDGEPVSIPMTGLPVAAPMHLPAKYKALPHTAPEFGAFVVRKTTKP